MARVPKRPRGSAWLLAVLLPPGSVQPVPPPERLERAGRLYQRADGPARPAIVRIARRRAADFTMSLARTGGTGIGGCDPSEGPSPTLDEVFPVSAGPDWSAACRLAVTGRLTVDRFDQDAAYRGRRTCDNVDRSHLGLYVMRADGGVMYSEDSRNGGAPQVLTCAGTNLDNGYMFGCFEDEPFDPTAQGEFSDSVVLVTCVPMPCMPFPARAPTWGSLKARCR
jgi:hypothetical protein